MRRRFLTLCLAIATALASVSASAQTTFRVVMHSDLKILDPMFTGGYIVRNHGYMVYDTLFAMDADFRTRPQMVDKWSTSADGLTWSFTLREGLEWHDGQPVTAEDCVASLKRWAARDSMGQKLALAIAEYKVVDDKTFQIVLKERFGQLIEAIGKPSIFVPFMMPKRVAATDPTKQIDDYTGSGPFILKKDEWKPGEKTVYVKNPRYKPRSEPMSGLAGGKVVMLDRVEWIWIPDSETQINALLKGEIDMLEAVNYDSLPLLEKDKSVRVMKARTSNQYVFRMNWMIPPFNDVRIRRAAAVALSQEDFLQANIGDTRYYRTCKALFTCGTPLETTAGTEDIVNGDAARARALLKEAGYDGSPIVLLQASDLGIVKQLPIVAKAQLERAGFRVEVQSMDWTTFLNRIATKKGPLTEGGWNAFGTGWSQIDILDPLMTPYLAATCEKARPGWPCDETMEKLRDKYVQASSDAEKKAVAAEAQRHAMQIVTHVPLGEWFGVWAVRSNIELPPVPATVTAFWGISKK
jgi:peptide/nickel transport system substrate-binding protein